MTVAPPQRSSKRVRPPSGDVSAAVAGYPAQHAQHEVGGFDGEAAAAAELDRCSVDGDADAPYAVLPPQDGSGAFTPGMCTVFGTVLRLPRSRRRTTDRAPQHRAGVVPPDLSLRRIRTHALLFGACHGTVTAPGVASAALCVPTPSSDGSDGSGEDEGSSYRQPSARHGAATYAHAAPPQEVWHFLRDQAGLDELVTCNSEVRGVASSATDISGTPTIFGVVHRGLAQHGLTRASHPFPGGCHTHQLGSVGVRGVQLRVRSPLQCAGGLWPAPSGRLPVWTHAGRGSRTGSVFAAG